MINRFHSPKPQPFDQSLPNQLKINHICFIVLMDQFKSEGGQVDRVYDKNMGKCFKLGLVAPKNPPSGC
jgi:hypothetical protein